MPKPYFTYLIIVANLIVFNQENQHGNSENLETLYHLGALDAIAVWQGEWWRIITANFLHYGWFHLGINMLSLYVLGSIIESSLGKIRYLIIYLLSGCLSMLLVAFYFLKTNQTETLLVGASAAIIGLVGAMTAIFLQDWWKHKNPVATRRLFGLILIIGIQFLIDYNTPQISLMSHLFGLIIGFISALILIKKHLND